VPKPQAPNQKTKPAARLLAVPGGLKHLDSGQMLALEDSFRKWMAAASKPHIRYSRTRIWLVFLLLRHTGAKLGEILALDPARHLDAVGNVVRLGVKEVAGGAGFTREVPVPREVMREISKLLSGLGGHTATANVFALDPGYVRRKFYERAEAAGLPRNLASPSVIRNSRAVEMLGAGMPLSVIQNVLGHANLGPTAQYFEFSEDNLESLKKYYLQKEVSRKTSARNVFVGKVVRILSGPVMSEVDMAVQGGGLVSALITNASRENLGLEPGSLAMATIKAPLVDLAKSDTPPRTSARNSFTGRVAQINDDATISEVVVDIEGETQLCALMSSQSVREMGIATGDTVTAFFKALSVVLSVD